MGLVHGSAEVDEGALIDPSAFVWGLAQIRTGASIGAESVIGRGAYIGAGVLVGPRTKIQNYALVYEPAMVEEGVFIGPGAILTNDRNPRAIRPDGALKGVEDWEAVGVTVRRGASIGAGAICIAPVEIGSWALVGAGAVVTEDVAAYALVVGSPARRIAWVGPTGERLDPGVIAGEWVCPVTGERFEEVGAELRPLGAHA